MVLAKRYSSLNKNYSSIHQCLRSVLHNRDLLWKLLIRGWIKEESLQCSSRCPFRAREWMVSNQNKDSLSHRDPWKNKLHRHHIRGEILIIRDHSASDMICWRILRPNSSTRANWTDLSLFSVDYRRTLTWGSRRAHTVMIRRWA